MKASNEYVKTLKHAIEWCEAKTFHNDILTLKTNFREISNICGVIDKIHKKDEFTISLFNLFIHCIDHFAIINKCHLLLKLMPCDYSESFLSISKKAVRNDIFVSVILSKIAYLVVSSKNEKELEKFVRSKYSAFHANALSFERSRCHYAMKGFNCGGIRKCGMIVMFNASPVIIEGKFVDYGALLENIDKVEYNPTNTNYFRY